MKIASLSPDQAPPISVPLRFFAVAPVFLALAALLLGLQGLAVAAVAEAPPVPVLASGSDLAVHGSVLSIRGARNETGGLIVSYVTLQVTEVLRGAPPPGPVVVRVPGGVLPEENLGMRASGAAEFRAGEEVVILLQRPVEAGLGRQAAVPAFYRVTGGALGKFEVRTPPQTGAKQALRSLGAVVGQQAGDVEAMSLDRLRALIRGSLPPGGR
mgnify:CR=1 FL=1